jgi:hypothetical protein
MAKDGAIANAKLKGVFLICSLVITPSTIDIRSIIRRVRDVVLVSTGTFCERWRKRKRFTGPCQYPSRLAAIPPFSKGPLKYA